MLYVDGVSSIASIDFRMDEWGVDLAVAGSQKGLMLPAGLGIVCAGPRALAAQKSARCTRVFFDFGDHIKANATGYFPYTPSLPMLYGLRESLNMLFEERLHRVFERHQVLADGVRAAVKAWGLRLCAKEPKWYSNTVSAIMVPPGIDGADVIDSAFRRYNLALGAGLSKVAGKLFRFGHLGDLNDLIRSDQQDRNRCSAASIRSALWTLRYGRRSRPRISGSTNILSSSPRRTMPVPR
jgi:alanine-glyoxylate transaminase/serine-glyoxylate transaminase/serine-pyruvate transaminase